VDVENSCVDEREAEENSNDNRGN